MYRRFYTDDLLIKLSRKARLKRKCDAAGMS